MNPSGLDASTCPLCGGPNSCALEMGKRIEDCWCFRARITHAVLERTPPEHRGLRCICPSCAALELHPEDRGEPRDA